MKAKVIGIGAAGNKVACTLIEEKVVDVKDVLLINSTLSDVPDKYRNIAIQFSNSIGGCGKERLSAKKLCAQSINDNTLGRLDSIMDPDDATCIIISSAEGGTGSGSAPLVAKYMKEVVGVNVHMVVFTGFEEDVRGLQNTIEYFQELSEEYTVEAISNSRYDSKNKLAGEQKANLDYAEKLRVLLGRKIVDSEQNIDETDLFKVTNTPGYMIIEHIALEERLKNLESFNRLLKDAIDDSKCLESPDKSAKRIAVILNLSERSRQSVDYTFKVLKEAYGVPFEVFTHIQNDGEEEYIDFIVSGMNLPLEEVEKTYKKYQDMSALADKGKDSFSERISQMTMNKANDGFDMIAIKKAEPKVEETIKKNKQNFLNDFNDQWESQMNGNLTFVNGKDSNSDEQEIKKKNFINEVVF